MSAHEPDWNDHISPACRVIGLPDPDQAIADEIAAYGRSTGASFGAITWGRLRAGNALKAGESGWRAYEIGKQAVDEYDQVRPRGRITGEPRRMLHEIACTDLQWVESNGTGTRGHVRSKFDGGKYLVTIQPLYDDVTEGC